MTLAFLQKLASAGDRFGPLLDVDRDLLLSVCNDVRPFAARRDIIREGERPEHVHLMIEGWSCRYKMLSDGSRQITAFLIPGDFCDTHITLFDEMDHSIASVGDSKVAFIARDKMRDLVNRPRIARALWWASLVDEAVLRAWIVNLGRRDAFERLGHLFCELHARLQNVGLIHTGEFELLLTQEELGDAVGLSSVHVSRTLKRLNQENLIKLWRQRVVILDVARLQNLVGFDPNYLHLQRNAEDTSLVSGGRNNCERDKPEMPRARSSAE